MSQQQLDKDTKRPQRYMKEAKLTEDPKRPDDTYETKRRVNNKFESEDTSTFNGMDYFKQAASPQQISEIMFKGSLRERFENLPNINTIEKMMMYSKYSKIWTYFKELDEMLLFMKNKQLPTFLTNICDLLNENKKLRITEGIFRQLYTIYPDAYTIQWSTNEKLVRLDKSDLFIQANIKSHTHLDERSNNFKQLMFDYIHKNGEHIPEAQLGEISKKSKVDEAKIQLLKQIQGASRTSELQTKVSAAPTLSKVSQNLIEKLRLKKQQQLLVTEHKAPIKQLITVASLLHGYYISRDVSNMFLNNVIKYTLSSLKQFLTDEAQLRAFVKQLSEACPNWLKIVDNPEGQILRMDRTVELPQIIKTIEQL